MTSPRFLPFGGSGLPGVSVYYAIDRSAVERKEIAEFVSFFDIDRINRDFGIHSIFGRIDFSIDGYTHDGVLHEIPEVRSFLKLLVKEWPYFFYADSLGSEFLKTLVFSITDRSTTILRDSDPEGYQIAFSPEAVNAACHPLVAGLNKVCSIDRSMTEQLYTSRVEEIRKRLQ